MGQSASLDINWPSSHPTDWRELHYLAIAVQEQDWSHTELCRRFEERFASFVGAKHALMVPSGTAAIYLALLASGIQPGNEVIIPGITWPSVVYSVVKAGGIPRPVDINRDSLCMEASLIEEAITPNTFAILATHLFGSQCEMQPIVDLARRQNLKIIEDSAQSIGSKQGGRACGTWGIAGAYSLNDKKVLSCGEGGVVVTDSDHVYEELKRLQLILPSRQSIPRHLPGTYKISEFQAAVGLAQLDKLDDRIAYMENNARLLSSIIECNAENLIRVQRLPSTTQRQSYYNYCLLVDHSVNVRDFRTKLSKKLGLKASAPYIPLSQVTDLNPYYNSLPERVSQALRTTLENCQEAYELTCVRLPHVSLCVDSDTIELVGRCILETLGEET